MIKDYDKFWKFSQDLMKDLRGSLDTDIEKALLLWDEKKKHPKTNEELVFGLIEQFDNVWGGLRDHDKFLKKTGISVRDGNRAIDYKTKSLVWQLQDGKCNGCGVRVGVHNDGDHMNIEWSKGGNGKSDNVQILCDDCHKSKTLEFMKSDGEDDE